MFTKLKGIVQHFDKYTHVCNICETSQQVKSSLINIVIVRFCLFNPYKNGLRNQENVIIGFIGCFVLEQFLVQEVK